MTPDEREEGYFRVMCEAELARERVRALLSENNATYAMLLNGMTYGYLEAWLHPTASLLWIECGRNLAALRRAAPDSQLRENQPLSTWALIRSGVAGVIRAWREGAREDTQGLEALLAMAMLAANAT